MDGLTTANAGLLMHGREEAMVPCTPAGVMRLLEEAGVELSGARAVVLGRSILVGKPMAQLLLGANATVTHCHSRTRDLPAVCREADVLVAAVGSAGLVTGDMVGEGAVVIDVGTNRTDDGLVGDVDFEAAKERARAITPVPGGVGPMTRAMLLVNTLKAARARGACAARSARYAPAAWICEGCAQASGIAGRLSGLVLARVAVPALVRRGRRADARRNCGLRAARSLGVARRLLVRAACAAGSSALA